MGQEARITQSQMLEHSQRCGCRNWMTSKIRNPALGNSFLTWTFDCLKSSFPFKIDLILSHSLAVLHIRSLWLLDIPHHFPGRCVNVINPAFFAVTVCIFVIYAEKLCICGRDNRLLCICIAAILCSWVQLHLSSSGLRCLTQGNSKHWVRGELDWDLNLHVLQTKNSCSGIFFFFLHILLTPGKEIFCSCFILGTVMFF